MNNFKRGDIVILQDSKAMPKAWVGLKGKILGYPSKYGTTIEFINPLNKNLKDCATFYYHEFKLDNSGKIKDKLGVK